eukprot:2299666-Amphidinium_carterae.1
MWPRPRLLQFVLSNNRFSGMLTEEGANFRPKALEKWMVDTNRTTSFKVQFMCPAEYCPDIHHYITASYLGGIS